MPLYTFHCKSCNHSDDEYRKLGNYAAVENCPKCGQFEYVQCLTSPHTEKDFGTPILFIAKGVHTHEEAKNLLAACPDITMNLEIGHPDWGLPLARNQAGKRQLYRYLGLVEAK